MAITAADASALNSFYGASGQYNWSQLLGQVTLGTPAAGTPTLTAINNAGLSYGPGGMILPTTNEQQLSGETLYGPSVDEQSLMGTGQTTYTVPGFGPMTSEQIMTAAPEIQNSMINNWSNVVSPGVKPAWGTLAGNDLQTALSKMQSEIGGGAYAGYSSSNAPTLKAQEDLGYIGGKPTLARDQMNAEAGQRTLALIAAQRGPANAFTQQAVLHGLDSTGLSKSIGAIQGLYGLPTFSAPNADPTPASLTTLNNQAMSGGAWTGAGQTYANAPASTGGSSSNSSTAAPVLNPADGGTTVYGGTHIHLNASDLANMDPTTAAYVQALPNPNKINGPNFEQLDDATKQFDLGAYQAAGIDPADVLSQVGAGLPQFKAPGVGAVGAASGLTG